MTPSSGSGQSFAQLIEAARAGDQNALGALLDTQRGWLRLFVADRLRPDLRTRVGDSDLIQQAMLSALKAFPNFQGRSAAELQAWLKQILDRNLLDTVRVHLKAGCRTVQAEEGGATILAAEQLLAGEGLSPIQELLFGEDAARIAAAIDELPEDQREAVRLRYFEDRSIQEVADHFGRTPQACAGLIKRGLATLRERLKRE